MFIAALFTIAKIRKQIKCPLTDEWIRRCGIYVCACVCVCVCVYVCMYIYTHTHTLTMEYYSAIKKNEIMPFEATWVDLEIIILSEVSQTEKDKYHMTLLMCGI